ncbi:1-deoxy-D-xylulose-5-phosphate reductoisomerase [Asticcacaulis sp. BYS171W]|uniref:1-deoxy-D-xylulose 5-phosphate reductoisomerase n=1 Tax=Asticcacaulis aquaticus TaxID=2984212 RepID=A0ABT5HP70_9CAUL|nr:1-deoxy-D-xylulose-5-phosphate reductoisomerase [Asticcacaulis aquaticus]MDC7681858.1 1-deoxy-D-xylulose-5-phosphate reductoisomerase [Asticcacaulis aquaticus]
MRRISILGSTGSVGVSTLNLIEETLTPGVDYVLEALCAGRNAELLAEQALKFRPAIAVIADESQWPLFQDLMRHSGIEIACGIDAVEAAAGRSADWVMAAIVGIAGLKPVWAAAGTGATIALANKESLVCCGRALIERAEAAGGRILPVDSEHNAIFQVFETTQRDRIRRLILTASGGPFRGKTREQLKSVTREQALKHPNWSMGAKITIDSATLANKGLELIEAAYLFDMPAEQIDVLVHPQSVVHSLVEYADGSTLAQMGPADMRVPISYCLGWPDRHAWKAPAFDLRAIGTLTFEAPDEDAFPMLRLAREALTVGGLMPVVFNAANEAMVQAFLAGRIGFLDIPDAVAHAMKKAESPSMALTGNLGHDIDRILLTDADTRAELAGRCGASEAVSAATA